jgi:glucose-6-phosphate 1-dehydrogenase
MNYIVIFGATGDLAIKKLFPALFNLFKTSRLLDTKVIAFSRRDWDDSGFRMFISDKIYENDQSKKEEFLNIISYQKGTFDDTTAYVQLSQKLKGSQRAFLFLAIQPEYYETVIKNFCNVDLNSPNNSLLIEKPFGTDEESAQKLDLFIKDYFSEDQVFLIDHYLHKKSILNLLAVKNVKNFKNKIFNDETIEKIELSLLEKICVRDRGEFYDTTGALRDVGQNHLLEILAMLAIPQSSKSLSDERLKILENIKLADKSEVIRGQYLGYRDVEGVRKDSITETYFKLECQINLPSWKNTKFVLQAGKNTGIDKKEVTITFRNGDILNFDLNGENRVWLNGSDLKVDVDYPFTDAYEKVFFDAMKNERPFFVGSSEILASWRFIDPIIKDWQNNKEELKFYSASTYPKVNLLN